MHLPATQNQSTIWNEDEE